jgi:hypothetical protein
MATYADDRAVEIAAGGESNITELTDLDGDAVPANMAEVLLSAQEEADAWINMRVRRLYSNAPLPLHNLDGSTPKSIIRLAAQHAVYVLRRNKGLLTQDDIDQSVLREAALAAIDKGELMPVDDDIYPIGGGTAIPGSFVRDPEAAISREKLRGFR